MTDVSIIGLGSMGLTLADLLLKAGNSVSLWNRSAEKAADLVARGAHLHPTPALAISASPITIICLYDYDAARSILRSEGVAEALDDRLLVNLGTGSPKDAQEAGAFVAKSGGRYLDGAIQAAPSQMGQPETPVLISGARDSFDEGAPTLRILGGNLIYLGERIEAASFMDLATLSYVYGAYAGFLHGAMLAEAVGINVGTYGNLVNDISPTFGAFFKNEGGVIESDDFTITESPLRISIPAVERILTASRDLGLNTEVPELVGSWLDRAERAGLADQELAAMIKVIRPAAPRT
ncbi:MAG: NAD(P)-dependent oxidoreductase [Sphingosinicella sp.]|nr:NAD(P)-dependent oxidoreductase [Sphingosinicella sp.]